VNVWFAHLCVTLIIYMYIYVHPKIWVRHQSLEPLSLPLQEARAAAAEVAELRGVAPWVLQTTHFTYPALLSCILEPLVGTVWLAVRKRGGHPCFVADCVYIYTHTYIYIYTTG
jgi:hypothetical protein